MAAQDNFVATVSHELRTPLASILGYLELVLDEPGHEEIQAELLVVHRNGQHLLGLVNDLISTLSTIARRVNPNRIRQVVGNLLSNAIKYSPEGGRITVLAGRSGAELECSIKNSGVGMSADGQEQAFTKFFRSARSRETAIPGAGLGLPVSKTIIEAHGGTIRLNSSPAAGTTATFTIPCADSQAPWASAPPQPAAG